MNNNIKELVENYEGNYKIPKTLRASKKDIEAAINFIGDDEKIIDAIPVDYKGDGSIMVLSSGRILIANKSKFKKADNQTILWRSIQGISIETKKLRNQATLIIKTTVGNFEIEKISKEAINKYVYKIADLSNNLGK